MRLVSKIVLLVSLSLVVVMGVVSWLSLQRTEQVLHREIDNQLNSNLDFAAKTISQTSAEITRAAEIIADNPAISKSLFLEISTGINQILNKMVALYPFYNYILIVTPDGDIFAVNTDNKDGHKIAGEELLGLNVMQTPLFLSPPTTGTVIGDPGPDPFLPLLGIERGMSQWFATPVLKGRTLIGWVVVSYDWQEEISGLLRQISGDLASLGNPIIGAALIDEKGKVVVGPHQFQKEVVPSSDRIWKERQLSFGKTPLRLLIVNDKTKTNEPIRTMRNFFLSLCGVSALFLTGALYFILHRTFLARLGRIDDGTKAFREGNLAYRLPSLGHDELGKLAATFNEMGQSLQKVVQDLDRERERLAHILSSNPAVIYTANPYGDYGATFISVNITGLLGYEPKEFLEDSSFWVSHLHPEDVQRVLDGLSLLFEQGHHVDEYRLRNKGGIYRWMRDELKLIRDEDGTPVEIMGYWIDVTDRKQAEESARKAKDELEVRVQERTAELKAVNEELLGEIADRKRAEEKNLWLAAIVESSDDSIIGKSLDGIITSWNKGAANIYGYQETEVVGKPISLLVPTEREDEVPQLLEKIASGGDVKRYETVRRKKDGRDIDVSLTISPIRNTDGTIIGASTIARDITELKRAEQALKESEQQYRTLFEDSIDGVYSVLRDGTITDANAAFCELFGYTTEEMIGKDIRELYLDPADRPRFQKEIEKQGFVKDYEVKWRKRDGTDVDCLLTTSAYFGEDGSIAGYRGIARDLTVQKGLERQLLQAQKMEAVGTLAGGVAHDFNNLLTVVMGFSELLLAEKDQKHPEYADLQKIFHAARSGADLVKRLLMFSRKSEPKPVPMNLNQQIVQVEKMLRRTISKMIDIHLDLSPDLPRINADPSQVEQVLMNLSINARDAMTDSGKLTVKTEAVMLDEAYCRLHVEANPGEYVLLEVSDTGHGMDKETAEHIFEPFFTTKEMGRGTGLGLATVYGIVKQHNGHITVDSEVGKGTTFRVYLPAIEGEVEMDVETTEIMPAVGTETVLLVEDEDLLSDLGSRILTKHGYTVLKATNGREALDVFEKERSQISLVILDLIMPEMGGTECLKEILKIDPQVNVLVASGYSGDASVKETLQIGAKGFVSKPFRVKELLRDVRRVLDEK
ncbi:MAG: PAS domain S-box protein [Desulfomonilaceae bacterium]